MYLPPAFEIDDAEEIRAAMRAAPLVNLVTATAEGPVVSTLPMLLDEAHGEHGVLLGHIARANPHWRATPIGESVAIFMGPDAYVTPSWYAAKQETGKVVPTWNYVTVHAHGTIEIFHDSVRLLEVVTRLTNEHERSRPAPWAVSDAPADYIAAQLRGIVGLRLPIVRLEGKRKMSQNRPESDRNAVATGLGDSDLPSAREAAKLMKP